MLQVSGQSWGQTARTVLSWSLTGASSSWLSIVEVRRRDVNPRPWGPPGRCGGRRRAEQGPAPEDRSEEVAGHGACPVAEGRASRRGESWVGYSGHGRYCTRDGE